MFGSMKATERQYEAANHLGGWLKSRAVRNEARRWWHQARRLAAPSEISSQQLVDADMKRAMTTPSAGAIA